MAFSAALLLFSIVRSWSVWVRRWASGVAGVGCWRRALCLASCWSIRRVALSTWRLAALKLCCLPPPRNGRSPWRTLSKGPLGYALVRCGWRSLSNPPFLSIHRKGLRVIAESEIGLAAIYASCDQHCNPSCLAANSGSSTRSSSADFCFHSSALTFLSSYFVFVV